MRVACNAIEGEIVWEGELSKKGRITRLWFRRSLPLPLFIVIITSSGHIYSRHLTQKHPQTNRFKLLYHITRETRIHFAIE